jgi:cellulose synthase/poly-beta-1,6-N-acetylglucosamine synthase-like glycosyltransferase
MKVTVIVPTYRRAQDLARCLAALTQQVHAAHEVIVVARDEDVDTWTFLRTLEPGCLPLKTATVCVSGVIAAMNTGLELATGEIIAFTDDDAAPHVDWLQRIVAQFEADDRIGGVGGRDAIQNPDPWSQGTKQEVGRLQWYGRIIGEHHRGVGAAREVDFLKGVNMSFRRSAIQNLCFDERMRGSGAQVHFELAFSLTLKRQGWKLIYDPAILVDHYVAQRFDEDQRHQFNSTALSNAVHNETLALLEHLSPIQRSCFFIWAITIGTTQAFGLLQGIRYFPSQGLIAYQKLVASLRGRQQGILSWLQSAADRTSPTAKSDRLSHYPSADS